MCCLSATLTLSMSLSVLFEWDPDFEREPVSVLLSATLTLSMSL